ncbi:NAD-dependent epimerase/dehydratase family protein [Synechocystis sp. CACIAM 05]|uniref:NAD-dependent epimerase/dehydratase family protein n=1 Tax=Synechocystis sp. CACIAM 05 TaxID=1933929 RepID=UPI00138E687E|nr:NAD(P)-dependent oxidoreductase [Synechocystis sp. CACIAM 05]QHU98990.1 epimerase [Synechocystis sp. CACIAM 05]
MSLTVLVTGATGFLGSHLVKAFLDQGYRVIILKRSFSSTSRIDDVLARCVVYNIDQCELSEPFNDFQKIHAIVHTATCYGRRNETTSQIVESNVLFPLQLLELATCNTDIFFNTDTSLSGYLNSYSLSKKHFLDWGKQFSASKKIKFVNLGLEHIFGPGDDESKFVTYVIKNCLRNATQLNLTKGEQLRDFIYVDDVVAVYQLLLSTIWDLPDYYQAYSVGSGNAITVRQLVMLIHCLTNSRTELNFGAVPYRDGEIMLSQADLDPLKKLGYLPSLSLEESLQKTIELEKLTEFN